MPARIQTFRDPRRPTFEDTQQRRDDQAFYKTARWKRLRAAKLRANPICECPEHCNQLAEQVHHVIDRKERQDLAFDWDNLESLTKQCHARITRQRQLRAMQPPDVPRRSPEGQPPA